MNLRNILSIRLDAILVALALIMRFGDLGLEDQSFVPLIILVGFGLPQAIQGLMLMGLFLTLNNAIVPSMNGVGLARYVVFFVAIISFLLRSNFSLLDKANKKIILYTISVGIICIFHSYLFSKSPDVSILKIIIWTAVMVSAISAWCSLSKNELLSLQGWIFRFVSLVLLTSQLTILYPSIGFAHNENGFQGILNHPQGFGVFLVAYFWFFMSTISTNLISLSLKYSFVIIYLFSIVMTQSRTAVISILLGGAVSAALLKFCRFVTINKFWQLFNPTLKNSLLTCLMLTLAYLIGGSTPAQSFLNKNNGTEGVGIFEVYKASRSILYEPMLNNIQGNPAGIGFGIPSTFNEHEVMRDQNFNIPYGLPAEKGFLFLGILEELGVLGLIAFSIWFVILFRSAFFNGFFQLATFCSIVLLNLGEATLLSTGGVGIFSIIFLAWSTSRSYSSSLKS